MTQQVKHRGTRHRVKRSTKAAGLSAAAVASLATGAVLIAAPANAHTPSTSGSCDGVSASASSYSGGGTVTATVDGDSVTKHFDSGGATVTHSVPQDGKTHAWSASVKSDGSEANKSDGGTLGPCGDTPPSTPPPSTPPPGTPPPSTPPPSTPPPSTPPPSTPPPSTPPPLPPKPPAHHHHKHHTVPPTPPSPPSPPTHQTNLPNTGGPNWSVAAGGLGLLGAGFEILRRSRRGGDSQA